MSTVKNITLRQAESWVFQITAHMPDGSVMDLTSATDIEWALAKSSDEEPHVFCNLEDAVSIVNAVEGKYAIVVSPDLHQEPPPGDYYWVTRVTRPDLTSQQAHGKATIEASPFAT